MSQPIIDAWAQPAISSAFDKLPEIQRLFEQSGTAQRLQQDISPTQLIDMMDWYHLVNVREESAAFDDYLKVRENLRKTDGVRKDAMNIYLDQVQRAFDRK